LLCVAKWQSLLIKGRTDFAAEPVKFMKKTHEGKGGAMPQCFAFPQICSDLPPSLT
jgi:hypothetical protein